MAVANTHRVPPKQWKKWPERSRVVFNDLYRLMRDNQKLFMHPKATPIPQVHWKTIIWNASWEAADAARNASTPVGTVVGDITRAGKIVRQHIVN